MTVSFAAVKDVPFPALTRVISIPDMAGREMAVSIKRMKATKKNNAAK